MRTRLFVSTSVDRGWSRRAARQVGAGGARAGDLRWLGRVTFGIDSATVARYRQLGREKFLDEQLHPPADDPADLAAAIAAIPVTQQTAEARAQGQSRRAAAHQRADRAKTTSRRRADGAQPGRQPGGLRDDQAASDAGARLAVAAARADDVVLDEPLQRLLRQGQRPLDAGRVRRAGGARARARPVQRSGHGDGDLAGDARVSRQRAERGRQDQRELRARADGAAHARRQRRTERLDLHAAGRAGAGARAHRRRPQLHRHHAEAAGRISRRSTCGADCSSSTRRATTSAPRRCWATRSPATAWPKSRTPSCCSAGSRRPRASSARSSPPTSSPTSRRRRWSSGWRARFRRPTARSRRCCARCSSTASFIAGARRADADSSRSSRTRCSSSCRRCGWPTTARRSRTTTRSSAGCSSSASRSTAGSRPTAIRSPKPRGPVRDRWCGASRSRAPSAAATPACSTTTTTRPVRSTGFPMLTLAAVLRRDRAGAQRAHPRRARPHVVAAGMEHDAAGVAGLDAALADRAIGGTDHGRCLSGAIC